MAVLDCLNELIRTLRERKSVEKLSESSGKYEFYLEEKSELKKQITKLKEEAKSELDSKAHIFNKKEFEINADNVLEIILICIMTGISDDSYFAHWADIVSALGEVEGKLKPLAKKIDAALDNELDLLTEFSEYEIFQMIFY